MPKIDRDVAIETTWSDYEPVLDVDRGSLSVVEPPTLPNESIYPPVDEKSCSGTVIHRESVSEENLEVALQVLLQSKPLLRGIAGT